MANSSSAITKTAALLMKSLSTRNRDIVSRRFGLKTGKKETLESIGKSYGITRERVRQIEEFSLNQLSKAVSGSPDITKYVSLAKEILGGNGGVMRESEMFKAFSGNDKENVINASLVFVLALAGEPASSVGGPVRFGENDSFHSFWALDNQSTDLFKNNTSELIRALESNKSPVAEAELASFVANSGVRNAKDVNVFLNVSKELGKNVFGEVGLISWAEVKPKGVRDKAFLILKKETQPKHFSEIAKLINTTGFSAKKANVQTVHNELIKDSRFVLVGRGMYGLSEWGYKPGTVKDVLIDVLKNSNKPLAKADLVAKVMNARMVKENTILLNLQDSKVFSKREDGSYVLRKA
ncbi:MAG: sigma factor-like helix-turn-helix DNA-binding protein [Candidatus Taylorbacteria bacterium]|nr:sigma factor-like helix-turn-helix DNA-binding protein [Candidatus Taylorbacteria bacterium]